MFCLTIPSLILDVKYRSSKRGCAGAFRYGGVIVVTQPGVALPLGVPHILAEDHIWQGYWGYTLQYLHLHGDRFNGITTDEQTVGGSPAVLCHLLIPHIIWTGSWRFLHGNQAEQLEEMILHDISTPRNTNKDQTLVYIQRFLFSLTAQVSHRIIPKLSKYPPRPWVPNGSLKVRTTQATLFLFHMGPKIRFPNLKEEFFSISV